MIPLKRRRVMHYAPLVINGFEFDSLVDTGACLSAIPLKIIDKIVAMSPQNVLLCRDKPSSEVAAANGESCPVMVKSIIA